MKLCIRLKQKSQYLSLEEVSKIQSNKKKSERMIRILDCFSWVTNRLNFLFFFLEPSQITIMQSVQF